MDCSCERCQSLCHSKPGWFTPEQIQIVGRKLNLTIKDLFRKYLTIDPVLIGGAAQPDGRLMYWPLRWLGMAQVRLRIQRREAPAFGSTMGNVQFMTSSHENAPS